MSNIPPYLVRVSGISSDTSKVSGTGFLVSRAGHVATCLHVVRKAMGNSQSVSVHIKGIEDAVTYKLLASSDEDDLAILESLPLDRSITCAILNPNWASEKEHWDSMKFYGHSSHQNYWEGQRIPCSISGMDYKSYRVGIAGSVNQGDSGAPVVDINDKIVGMIAQKDATRQGHARFVPISPLINLLTKNGITYQTDAGEKDAAAQRQRMLLDQYRSHLQRTVGRVRLFNKEHTLERVFVELSVVAEYERPSRDAEWVGVADAGLRGRRGVFLEKAGGVKEQIGRRTLKPAELLRRNERAFIVGAPGCGKTTLLKHLVLKTLEDTERLPVLLELKNVTEEALSSAGDNLLEILFNSAICNVLHLNDTERQDFREVLSEELRRGSLAVFLDGLDECSGTTYFDRLCRSIGAFDSSAHTGSLIVSSRPYAHRALGSLRPMEIAPLTPTQIKRFLNHYFDEGDLARQIYSAVRRRREMLELARVPFLLSVIAQVFEPNHDMVGERLSLYHLMVKRLVVELDQDRGLKRFRIEDPDGSRKWAFLRLLAFERLLVDDVEGATQRLVFDDEVLAEKARRFCKEEGLADYRLFLSDVKQSPLLRQVRTDTYAFSHLTIQEYLAAERLRAMPERKEIFIRAYLDPVLAEMEVLPMAVGLISNPNEYYQMIEELPDSVNLVNLRLRARVLAYVQNLDASHQAKLESEIICLLFDQPHRAVPFSDSVFRSLSAAKEVFLEPILARVESLFEYGHHDLRIRAAHALGLVGHERSVRLLARILREQEDVRAESINALKAIGGEAVVDEFLQLLRDKDPNLRDAGLFALSDLGGDLAVERLLEFACLPKEGEEDPTVQSFMEAINRLGKSAMANQLLVAWTSLVDAEDGTAGMWLSTVLTLFHLEGKRGLAELLIQVKLQNERSVQHLFIDALRKLNADKTAPKLLDALAGENWLAREQAGLALTKLNDDCIVPGLIDIINTGGDWRDERAAPMLAKMAKAGDARALEGLRSMLRSEKAKVRRLAASLLKAIDARQAGPELLEMFRADPDGLVRSVAAGALDWTSFDDLIEMLQSSDAASRMQVLGALAHNRDGRVIPVLCQALRDDQNEHMTEMLARALGNLKARSAVPELLSALAKSTELDVRKVIIEALGEIGSPRALDALLIILQEGSNEFFQTAPQRAAEALGKLGDHRAVPHLVKALGDYRAVPQNVKDFANHSLCSAAASALGELKSEVAVDALGQVLRSGNDIVSESVAKALQKIGGAHAASQLLSAMALLEDRERLAHVTEAINGIGDIAIADGFIRNLSARDEVVRGHAATHVSYYRRNEQVVSRLTVMSSDDGAPNLQRIARAALSKLSRLPKQLIQPEIEFDHPVEPSGGKGDFLSRCSLAQMLSDQLALAETEPEALALVTAAKNHDDAHDSLAVRLLEQGKTEEAEQGLRDWLECSPNSEHAHHKMGWFLHNHDRADEAKTEYQEAIRLNPDADGSHNNLGLLYWQEYYYEAAEREFREAIRCDPEDAIPRHNLGKLLVTLERPVEAETEFREASRLDPENTEVIHSLAMLLGELGRLGEAEAAYLEELKLNSTLDGALNNLGLIYDKQGRVEEAERAFRDSIRCVPNLLPHRNLKNLLVAHGRVAEIEAELRVWIHNSEALSELHSDLAELLDGQGRADEAIAVYREWLKCAPESTVAYEPLVRTLIELGREVEAEAASREWVERSPADWQARRCLWDILISQGRAAKALEDYTHWVNHYEDERWIRSLFVELLLNKGFAKEAEDTLLEQIQYLPESFSARYELADFYLRQGRPGDAERLYREWLTNHDEDGLFHYRLGLVLAEMGRMSEAQEQILTALKRFDVKEEDSYRLVTQAVMQTYAKLERYAEGAAICRQVLHIKPDVESYNACATLEWYGGALHEALSDLNRALELEPTNMDALNARGQIRAELGEYEIAIADLRRVIESLNGQLWNSTLAYAKNGLAFAVGAKGDIDEAMKLFKESIDQEPENAWVYFNRALIHKSIEDDTEAKKNLILSIEKTGPRLPPRLYKTALKLMSGQG